MHADVELPMPPLELRELVGLEDPTEYENPTGAPIFDGLEREAWRVYLDFGSGCGRSARRLLQQDPRPQRYIGIDLHSGMVNWCQENLTKHAESFTFIHHDVYNPGLNPNPLRPWVQPLPVDDRSCTMVEATSVFTHLVEGQVEFYLDEVERVLADDGHLMATWFLFDKSGYPYMQDGQNALYINDRDPTNAVAYDRDWLQASLDERGLAIVRVTPPSIRGFQWLFDIIRVGPHIERAVIPEDTAPIGRRPPPLLRVDAARFGLEGVEYTPRIVERSRQQPPTSDPLAIELRNAKEYIASLECELARAREYITSLEEHRAASEGTRGHDG